MCVVFTQLDLSNTSRIIWRLTFSRKKYGLDLIFRNTLLQNYRFRFCRLSERSSELVSLEFNYSRVMSCEQYSNCILFFCIFCFFSCFFSECVFVCVCVCEYCSITESAPLLDDVWMLWLYAWNKRSSVTHPFRYSFLVISITDLIAWFID